MLRKKSAKDDEFDDEDVVEDADEFLTKMSTTMTMTTMTTMRLLKRITRLGLYYWSLPSYLLVV